MPSAVFLLCNQRIEPDHTVISNSGSKVNGRSEEGEIGCPAQIAGIRGSLELGSRGVIQERVFQKASIAGRLLKTAGD
jgi:hypothetical protein